MISLLYMLIGIVSGLLSGLLGISGGTIVIPSLFFLFQYLQFPQEGLMHLVIGTSLASMCFNSLSSTWTHAREKNVAWDLSKALLPGLLLGSFAGALVADHFASRTLELLFTLFAFALGAHYLVPHKHLHLNFPQPGLWGLFIWGLLIAFLSNILGIGGGIFAVPLLHAFGLSIYRSIGTSAFVGVVITLCGALFYWLLGSGNLYLPAVLFIGLTSFFTAPLGVYLSRAMPLSHLKKMFGLLLILSALLMGLL